MRKVQIHHHEQHLKLELEKLRSGEGFHGDNADQLKGFYVHLCSLDFCVSRKVKYLQVLRLIDRMVKKSFKDLTKEEIVLFVNEVHASDWSVWTKRDYKIILRKILIWLLPEDDSAVKVGWMKTYVKRKDQTVPTNNDLITQEEFEAMMEISDNNRDRALISILFETGARIGEIGSMIVGDVQFDKFGANLDVDGKTGQRKVRIVQSTNYLMNWLESHPEKNNPQSPLWVQRRIKRIIRPSYSAIRLMIQRTARRAGIKKRVHPHLFRHSRATVLADSLTELQMNAYFGWIQGSNMPATYVHMNGKNIDNAILKMHGLGEEEKEKQPEAKKCHRCGHINPYSMQNCIRCAGFLDQKAVFEQEEFDKKKQEMDQVSNRLLKTLMKDPKIQGLVVDKLRKTGQLAELINLSA